MSHKRLLIAATIIAALLAVSFFFSVPHTREVTLESVVSDATPAPVVELRDTFKKGVHTITGSLSAPNACASVSASALLTEASSTQAISVAVSMETDTDVCLQVPTKMNFSTTLTAPARLPLVVSVNGISATTTTL